MKHKIGFYYQYTGNDFSITCGGFSKNSLYQCIDLIPLSFENDLGNLHPMNEYSYEFIIPQNMTNRQLMDLCGCGNETNLSKPFNPYLK